MLTQSKNLELLMNLAGEWVDRVHQRKSLKQRCARMRSGARAQAGREHSAVPQGALRGVDAQFLITAKQFNT